MRLELRPGVVVNVSRRQLAEFIGAVILIVLEALLIWKAVAAYLGDDVPTGLKYSAAALAVSCPTVVLLVRWRRAMTAGLVSSD